jgi:hypothetical protein
MAEPMLKEDLWRRIEPLIPKHRPSRRGGRQRVPDQAALTGIVFVLRTGIQWEYLPRETGCGRNDLLASAAGLVRGRRLAAHLGPPPVFSDEKGSVLEAGCSCFGADNVWLAFASAQG